MRETYFFRVHLLNLINFDSVFDDTVLKTPSVTSISKNCNRAKKNHKTVRQHLYTLNNTKIDLTNKNNRMDNQWSDLQIDFWYEQHHGDALGVGWFTL